MNKPNDMIDYMHDLSSWHDWMDSEEVDRVIDELECIDNSEYRDLDMDEFLNEMY